MATVKSIETDLAVVKNDVAQMGQLFAKLEVALDKITDVSNNIGQILAVHERRLADGEQHFDNLKADMQHAEVKFDDEVKDLHSRLTTNSREIESKMTNEIDKVLEAIKDLKSHMVDKHDELELRLAALERWRWILLGALTVGGFFLGNGLEITDLF
jgi:chromosome segregation ATPase